ncbi:MAG: hypothetical protein M0P40_09415 [Bacteroidales bacterium]|jgi:hypothetical protein|nr:hypothetical protein [Bacteroidales bacterium]
MKKKKEPPPEDVFMEAGAWVEKVVSLMPLIERERRRKRIRAKRMMRYMTQ